MEGNEKKNPELGMPEYFDIHVVILTYCIISSPLIYLVFFSLENEVGLFLLVYLIHIFIRLSHLTFLRHVILQMFYLSEILVYSVLLNCSHIRLNLTV